MSVFSNMMNPVCGLSGPATISTAVVYPQYALKTSFLNGSSNNIAVRIYTASFDWTWNIYINGVDFEVASDGYIDLTDLILSRTSDLTEYWDISIFETTATEAQASNTNPSAVSMFPAWLNISTQTPADTFRIFTEEGDEEAPFYQWLYGDYLGIDPTNESLLMEIVAHGAQREFFKVDFNSVPDLSAITGIGASFTFGRPAGGTYYTWLGGSDPASGTEGIDSGTVGTADEYATYVATRLNSLGGPYQAVNAGSVYSPDAGILVVKYINEGPQTNVTDIDTGLTMSVTQQGSA